MYVFVHSQGITRLRVKAKTAARCIQNEIKTMSVNTMSFFSRPCHVCQDNVFRDQLDPIRSLLIQYDPV